MSMCGVYYVGDNIRLTWNKTTESYDEYREEKYRLKGASTKV